MFLCDICGISFSQNDNFKRHLDQIHNKNSESFKCEICEKIIMRKDNYKRHLKIIHSSKSLEENNQTSTSAAKRSCDDCNDVNKKVKKMKHCDSCKMDVPFLKFSGHLKSLAHKNTVCEKLENCDNVELIRSAFQNRLASYRVRSSKTFLDIDDFFHDLKQSVLDLIKKNISIHTAVKINFELFGMYFKASGSDENLIGDIKSFNTKNIIFTQGSCLDEEYQNILQKMKKKSEDFQERDSGWALQKILYLEVNFVKYNPLKASSYIDLPAWIKKKKAVINVINKDDACFAWAIVSAIYPQNINMCRTSSYPHFATVLNIEGIEFPIKFTQIATFGKLNNISVNVYGEENNYIVGPLYFTSKRQAKHVNLLYIEKDCVSHYCWIKNLSRLISSQLSACDGCLIYFKNEDRLKLHQMNDCNKVRTFLPSEADKIMKFKNFRHKLRLPFVIYGDFESLLKPIQTCIQSEENSFTESIQVHEPYSFAYYIKCSYDEKLNKFEIYRGSDCGKFFMNSIQRDIKNIYTYLKTIVPMTPLTDEQTKIYDNEQVCHICENSFNEGNIKVRDHCHLTGEFRGAAHDSCNLQYKIPDFIPIVFHNLSGYDAHFVACELGFDMEKIDLIAQNKEKYISFTKTIFIDENNYIKLRFIDSFKFMATSLSKLVETLSEDQFTTIRQAYPNKNQYDLLTRKGIFPYDYITSMDVLNETCLPPQEAFYNEMSLSHISESDYIHAKKVWETFKCKTLGEYSDLYLKTDVLLLTDVFEQFRSICLKTYSLDPAHYFTAPGFSWDAMLKYTNIELELLTNIDMYHFIQKGIRGGLSQCSTKYAKANNKYINTYNQNKDSIYLIYLDANNLYGWAMHQYLPYGNFQWVPQNEIEMLVLQDMHAEMSTGYIFEVDIKYPEELQIHHSDLPLCPEKVKSEYVSSKETKLITSLNDKKNYVLHYLNLKQCLEAGMRIIKIHRVLKFNQSPWLRKYIDLNTNLRIKATTEFEKDHYKLLNNCVFGKTMENVDKRVDVRLLPNWEKIGKRYGINTLVSKPNFHSFSIFTKNLVAVQMNRLQVKYNRPIYVGFCVLDISKTLMYDFHYNYMKSKFNDRIKLLYIDTDSLIYSIKTEDFYMDIKQDLERFDTSNYAKNNNYNIPLINKKIIGKFKDENGGKIMSEFIGIKSKSYCCITENDELKKIKGIQKSVVSKHITVEHFRECLNSATPLYRVMRTFKSCKHVIYTQLKNKIALLNNDDKRFVIPNSTETLPWGHKSIEEYYFI